MPEEAIATDQGQRQVYVINSENKIETRRVTTGILVNVPAEESSDRGRAAE